MLRKLALIGLALLAARMAGRAARREAEVIALLWTLIEVTAAAGTTGTAKARSTEARVAAMVPVIHGAAVTANTANSTANTANSTANTANSRVGNLSGNNTSSSGLANGTINGHTDTAALADGTIGGSTGQINTGGGTAHTHGSGSLAVNNGHHEHGASSTDGTLAVANGNHSHNLPSV